MWLGSYPQVLLKLFSDYHLLSKQLSMYGVHFHPIQFSLNLLVSLKGITELIFIPYLQPFLLSFYFFFQHKSAPSSLLVGSLAPLHNWTEGFVCEPAIKDPEWFWAPVYKLGPKQHWAVIRKIAVQRLLYASGPFCEPVWRLKESIQLALCSSIGSKSHEFSSYPWRFHHLQLIYPIIKFFSTTLFYRPLVNSYPFRRISM